MSENVAIADLLPFLLLAMTFGAALWFLVRSKKRTEDRLDHKTEKSALAEDGPTGETKDRIH